MPAAAARLGRRRLAHEDGEQDQGTEDHGQAEEDVAESHDQAADMLDEDITIRFDGNTDPNLPWTFRPMQTELTLKIGQDGLAFYEAVNNSDKPVTGRASYNVAPEIAGSFFVKIACFCFTEQTLQPGERVEMPVTFYVDPEIVTDRDAYKVRDITLSYTFHQYDTAETAALSKDQATPVSGVDTTRTN